MQAINGWILKNHIEHYAKISFSLLGKEFHQRMYVMNMEGPPHIILGMPWLKEVNPQIDWCTQKVVLWTKEGLLQG